MTDEKVQPLTKNEKIQIALRCEADFKFFCKYLLTDSEAETGFTTDFTPIHDDIIPVLADYTIKKKLILAPRGIGKTALLKAKVIHAILFRKKRVILFLAPNHDEAVRRTEDIKYTLKTNKKILDIFGDVKVGDNEEEGEFTKSAWVAFNYTIVIPFGCGQPIRGTNWRDNRPDLICLDDVEVIAELQSDISRERMLRWMLSDVMESYDKLKVNYEICYCDTIKHFGAIPIFLQKLSDWTVVNSPMCDEHYTSRAPVFLTTEAIKIKMDDLRSIGQIDLFYREYMNIPRDPESATFQPQYFRYFDVSGDRYDFQGTSIPGKVDISSLEKVALVDPSKTTNPSSDFSASVVVGIDTDNRALYILDIFSGRVSPAELYDAIIEQIKRYKLYVVGLEVTSLNLFITHPFLNELKVQNLEYVEVIELKASSKKELRIAALSPLYRRGYIFHNKSNCQRLEEQLLTAGFSDYDDEADAFAYIIPQLASGSRYFTAEPDPIRRLTHESADAIEAEYAEITNEPPLEWSYAV